MKQVKSWVKNTLPTSLVNQHRINKEAKALQAVSRQACDPHKLRHTPVKELEGIFSGGSILPIWREVQSTIKGLSLPELTGGVSPGDQRAIFYLIQHLKPIRILEIGTHIGCSTVHFALAQREAWLRDGSLTTVDIRDVNDKATQPWKEFGSLYSPAELMSMIACEGTVEFRVSNSLEFLQKGEDKYDFIFLDGDHKAATVYQELPLALSRLNTGGVVLLHDYFPRNKPLWNNQKVIPGPYLAVQRLIQEGAQIRVLPLGELPWPTKLESQVTSLALVSLK